MSAPMPEPEERRRFLTMAATFEASLAGLALLLGWIAGIDPLETLRPTGRSFVQGLVAAVPILILFWLTMRYPVGSIRPIRTLLLEWFAPYLASCRTLDLVALACIAGLSEEMLFRGLLQPWMSGYGPLAGLIASNIVFGLAHAVTPTYAVLAGAMGVYLGWLWTIDGEPNLVAPIVTHAAYDAVAFWHLVRVYRRGEEAENSPTSETAPTQDDPPPS